MGIKKELLEILACPKCRGDIEESKDQKWLICRSCMLAYEVREDIPIMLIDEAKNITKIEDYV